MHNGGHAIGQIIGRQLDSLRRGRACIGQLIDIISFERITLVVKSLNASNSSRINTPIQQDLLIQLCSLNGRLWRSAGELKEHIKCILSEPIIELEHRDRREAVGAHGAGYGHNGLDGVAKGDFGWAGNHQNTAVAGVLIDPACTGYRIAGNAEHGSFAGLRVGPWSAFGILRTWFIAAQQVPPLHRAVIITLIWIRIGLTGSEKGERAHAEVLKSSAFLQAENAFISRIVGRNHWAGEKVIATGSRLIAGRSEGRI
ncbi:MAG: hypothetical protein BWY83_01861 [bacterium ADurb.Bin478]|nr:MAG: hypothetical protein BWY83_01861 [bacterium ADurb.Bin478]